MIPFEKLGLASSVAKAANYSWRKTVELASRSNFKQIQLYLSEENLQTSTADFLRSVQLKFTVHLHLPPSINPQHLIHFLSLLSRTTVSQIYLIQHQPLWYDFDRVLDHVPVKSFLPCAENDWPEQWPLDFLNWFLKVKSKTSKALPVIDVPRFFHQAPRKAKINEMVSQVVELVHRLLQMNQPFILHTIDHPAEKTDRPYWQPLLEGELPWPEILNLVKIHPDLLKCLMFEYENWNMVQDSIKNLKKLKLIADFLR